ncbi:hypothetical protein GCM10007276_12190 [Agaricicola taiwanensis]|uniref:Uncharacterized protein n=2 Tax=Agaricicola taiwanensis TaxID=591372 RepID=A0A8J2VUW4_9RHOB|nr:hypothetical protein GCM10007276_12190 [Agaricicola taiwanensis]
MPRYRSHKEVWALKIASVDGTTLTFEKSGYAPLDVGAEFIERHKPEAGGYYVVYKDGYKSFSPAEPFEEGYTFITKSMGG